MAETTIERGPYPGDSDFHQQIMTTSAGRRAMAIFFGKGDKREAVEAFTKVLDIYPDNLLARAMRAECRMLLQSEMSEALSDSEAVLALQPDRLRMHYVKGAALILLERFQEAIAPLEFVLKNTPGTPRIVAEEARTHTLLALAHLHGDKDYAKALRYANKAVRLDPNDAMAHHMVISIRKESGEEEKAMQYTMRLMDHHPGVFARLMQWTNSGGERFPTI